MITVKLYGLLRLDSGIKQIQTEADSVRDVFASLIARGVKKQTLDGCVILVNGKTESKRKKLNDGDVVLLLPPVAGG